MPIDANLYSLKKQLASQTDFVLDYKYNGRTWFSVGKEFGGKIIFAHIYDRDLLVEFTFKGIGTASFIRSPLVSDCTKLDLICPVLFKEAKRYCLQSDLNSSYFASLEKTST